MSSFRMWYCMVPHETMVLGRYVKCCALTYITSFSSKQFIVDGKEEGHVSIRKGREGINSARDRQ